MAFDLFQDVILTRDVPQQGLCAGDVGTVVERHVVPGEEDGYSVEFFDMTGRTISIAVLRGSDLRAPNAADIPAVRLRKTG